MIPTRDHAEIRIWAARHNAVPAEIMPRAFDSQPAVLHFLTGDATKGTPELRPISWESFFAQFDLLGLSFTYDENTSRFDLVRVEQQAKSLQN